MRQMKLYPISPSEIISTTVPITETAWSSSVTYAIGQTCYKGMIAYESVQSANTNHNPETDEGTWWLNLGYVNSYRMFDAYTNTYTSADDEITVRIQKPSVSAVGLVGLSAARVDITVLDGTGSAVVTYAFDLYEGMEAFFDWWDFIYGPELVGKSALYVNLDFITLEGESVSVSITGSGTVKCGGLMLGESKSLGTTTWETSLSGIDYSKNITDDFGRTYLAQGATAMRLTASVKLNRSEVSYVLHAIQGSAGAAYFWDFSEDSNVSAMVLYGVWQTWDMTYQSGVPFLKLEIKGLI